MGRSPCCDKSGLKKGPWTTEEDVILTNFINQNGHGNWRALPKRAGIHRSISQLVVVNSRKWRKTYGLFVNAVIVLGLMRCGKSCRLRWMNYLRPDIKRGNFTMDEEEMIIKLHQEMGNKYVLVFHSLE